MASRAQGKPYENMERDPCPPGGYPPVKQIRNPDSNFNESLWTKSKIKTTDLITKGRAQEQYKLTNVDMSDLYYRATEGPGKNTTKRVTWKLYFKFECERRAWEVHGGPEGLNFALKARNYDRERRARTSGASVRSPQKTVNIASSRTIPERQKALRLELSAHNNDEDEKLLYQADFKSEDNSASSSELIPSSTPQRRKLSTPKKRSNGGDEDLGPQKRFKSSPNSKGDETPFQLLTPSPTVRRPSLFSAKMSTWEDVLEVLDSDAEKILRSPSSPLLMECSKSSGNQPGPSTPVKREYGLPSLPTPVSSPKVRQPRGRTRQQREDLGTLDCDWDSDHEVRVSWI